MMPGVAEDKRLWEHLSVPTLVYQEMIARGDATAIASSGRRVTYAQFSVLSNAVQQALGVARVRHGDVVALCVPPSPEFIAAAFAVMNAGAIYVPIDETWPAERIEFIVADSGARAFLTTSERGASLRLPSEVTMIEVHSLKLGRATHAPSVNPDIRPEDLAYMIYTSGSTGRPKGVELKHRGLSNLVAWHNSTFKITHNDRCSQIAGLGFDASVWEIFPSLAAGAAIYIPDPAIRQDPTALKRWLLDSEITVAFVPTILAEHLLLARWPSKTRLRLLLTGGEALRTFPPKGLPFTLVNNYGPTECTVVSTSASVPVQSNCGAFPAIGRPILNTEVHILTEDLKPVRPGDAGELYIGGPSIARGYHNRPELTAERFIPNPFSGGDRLYRTGDLVRRRGDQQLEFLGRLDDQVKIRGYRVELNEISTVLQSHPGIKQCVVIARSSESGEKELVAYVVLFATSSPTQQDLHDFLRKSLPVHMLPSKFVSLERLPLTANGKIDHRALPTPSRENAPGLGAIAPAQDELQGQIAKLIAKLLHIRKIGMDDNFFLLGGHSLLGAQLIAQLNKRFNVDVPLRTVFESPTVASLAERVWSLRAQTVESAPASIKK